MLDNILELCYIDRVNILVLESEIKMLNTNEFKFDKKTRTLSAEASELSSMPALGASFPVKSEHTNRVMYFQYSETLFDASDEDMMGWEFKPVAKLDNVDKLIIWND